MTKILLLCILTVGTKASQVADEIQDSCGQGGDSTTGPKMSGSDADVNLEAVCCRLYKLDIGVTVLNHH